MNRTLRNNQGTSQLTVTTDAEKIVITVQAGDGRHVDLIMYTPESLDSLLGLIQQAVESIGWEFDMDFSIVSWATRKAQ